jgi:adenylate kinase family enzyme
MRILIAGIPRSGKTTLATTLEREHKLRVFHTDSLIPLGWSEASDVASGWIEQPAPWIIEGVAVVRALRKWLAKNSGKPADVVHWLDQERVPLSDGQTSMAIGCRSVWREVLPELLGRRVKVVRG